MEYATCVDRSSGRVGYVHRCKIERVSDYRIVDGRVLDHVLPNLVEMSVEYILSNISLANLLTLRHMMDKNPTQWWAQDGWHFSGGMAIRNLLREGGFGEDTLGVLNLDDVYIEILERALSEIEINNGASVVEKEGM